MGDLTVDRHGTVAQHRWDQLLQRGLEEGQTEAGEDHHGALRHQIRFLSDAKAVAGWGRWRLVRCVFQYWHFYVFLGEKYVGIAKKQQQPP